MTDLKKIELLGVGITTNPKSQILEYILKGLAKRGGNYYIVTPNPELLVLAATDKGFRDILNGAKIALPDGVGVVAGAQILGKGSLKRITGVDFVDFVCKEVADLPITAGFLGAGPGVAVKTAECLVKKYPGLKVSFAISEYSDLTQKVRKSDRKAGKSEIPKVRHSELYGALSFSESSECDILFVAFGSPKQEKWIAENLSNLPARVVVGVGGAFDMISGNVPRAPQIIRSLGLEFLFRLLIQPWRVKRQMRLLVFIYLVIKEKLKTQFTQN